MAERDGVVGPRTIGGGGLRRSSRSSLSNLDDQDEVRSSSSAVSVDIPPDDAPHTDGLHLGLVSPTREAKDRPYHKYVKPRVGYAFQCRIPKFVDQASTATGGSGGVTSTSGSEESSDAEGPGGESRQPRRLGSYGSGSGRRVRHRSSSAEVSRQSSDLRGGGGSATVALSAAEQGHPWSQSFDYLPASVVPGRGGLCVHRPAAAAVAVEGVITHGDDGGCTGLVADSGEKGSGHFHNPGESFLVFARNLVLQTPRPLQQQQQRNHNHPPSIAEDIWDAEAERIFGTVARRAGTTSTARCGSRGGGNNNGRRGSGGGTRGVKRKAMTSSPDDSRNAASDEDRAATSSSTAAGIAVAATESSDAEFKEADGGSSQMGSDGDLEASRPPPLLGLENDERMLAYLQTQHGGNGRVARFSLLADLSRGKAVQTRRQLRKKRKQEDDAYVPPPFTSESWRWRYHQACPTMLGDVRVDPGAAAYPYFASGSGLRLGLLGNKSCGAPHGSACPWRVYGRTVGDGDHKEVTDEEENDLTRLRSGSIDWSAGQIEESKKIWRLILAYSQDVLHRMDNGAAEDDGKKRDDKEGTANSKPALSELILLVSKAHALPTPEETFGRRDTASRLMSQCMNSILDEIEIGRDCLANLSKYVHDEDGDGIELDDLRRILEETETKCKVNLDEMGVVKEQLQDAVRWEEKLDKLMQEDDAQDKKGQRLDLAEQLLLEGKELPLHPRSLVRLERRVQKARSMRQRICEWNEARNQENPQKMKFVASLMKEVNRIGLMFPEVYTLTMVHQQAEEWMDRATVAVRSKISLEELERLVELGEELPLNVSDVLEKLQNRLKEAQDWINEVQKEVPCSEGPQVWLEKMRAALNGSDEGKVAALIELSSEGSRIPVDMDCLKLLQIEIDARNWSMKATKWIPPSLDEVASGEAASFRKAKVDDVREYLERASAIRDRLPFSSADKDCWEIEGEEKLKSFVAKADKWFKKYRSYYEGDNRRNQSRCCMSMQLLGKIVKEGEEIPVNLGPPFAKMSRIFSQAEEWMKQNHALFGRCGIKCGHEPSLSEGTRAATPEGPVKLAEITAAVSSAESDISVDLEEARELKSLAERVQKWFDGASTFAPKRSVRKRKNKGSKQEEKHDLSELEALIEEASSIPVDTEEDLDRLRIELSLVQSWRLQAQRDLRDIASAFNSLREERSSFYESSAGRTDVAKTDDIEDVVSSPTPMEVHETPKDEDKVCTTSIAPLSVPAKLSEDNDESSTQGSSTSPGTATPTSSHGGGKAVYKMIASLVKSAKAIGTYTAEERIAEELNLVSSWLTRSCRTIESPGDVYEKQKFKKLEKLIQEGGELRGVWDETEEELKEAQFDDSAILEDVGKSWEGVLSDDIKRLEALKEKRSEFLEWCEKAKDLLSSSEKKIPIETLEELAQQSSNYPSTNDVVKQLRKRASDADAWAKATEEFLESGKTVSLEEAKDRVAECEELNMVCPAFRTLRNALRATRGWLLRVKKCGVDQGQTQINDIKGLISEHEDFIVAMPEEVSKLRHALCGYCLCRQPYDGFMIGCDSCEEWYHGPCIGVSESQAERYDRYVCVRCCTERVYKETANSAVGVIRKWTGSKGIVKARQLDSQRYGRKVRQAERDMAKSKSDIEEYMLELNKIRRPSKSSTTTSDAVPPQSAVFSVDLSTSGDPLRQADQLVGVAATTTGSTEKLSSREKDLLAKIEKARVVYKSCSERMEKYEVELADRKKLEMRENAAAPILRKWCCMVRDSVLVPLTTEEAELSRPLPDGGLSAPMNNMLREAQSLGIIGFPDVAVVISAFKSFSWCLRAFSILSRKPKVEELRALVAQSGAAKLPEAKCVRMLRSMLSRASLWQVKVKKALAPIPGETKPYETDFLTALANAAKELPMTLPEESRLWNTIEDKGNRHCVCGGPSDGSFMLGCDKCDRWFHGECVNLDKETGDALTNWICPPCVQSGRAVGTVMPSMEQVKIERVADGPENQKNPPPAEDKFEDTSPHAPDPKTLWPPFGLVGSEKATSALGVSSTSDCEGPSSAANIALQAPSKPPHLLKPGLTAASRPSPALTKPVMNFPALQKSAAPNSAVFLPASSSTARNLQPVKKPAGQAAPQTINRGPPGVAGPQLKQAAHTILNSQYAKPPPSLHTSVPVSITSIGIQPHARSAHPQNPGNGALSSLSRGTSGPVHYSTTAGALLMEQRRKRSDSQSSGSSVGRTQIVPSAVSLPSNRAAAIPSISHVANTVPESVAVDLSKNVVSIKDAPMVQGVVADDKVSSYISIAANINDTSAPTAPEMSLEVTPGAVLMQGAISAAGKSGEASPSNEDSRVVVPIPPMRKKMPMKAIIAARYSAEHYDKADNDTKSS